MIHITKRLVTFNKYARNFNFHNEMKATITLSHSHVALCLPHIDETHKACIYIKWTPSCWYRYVDDTFVIWPHGRDKLQDFLNHINGLHKKIQFTMEIEKDGHLPFLDIDIYRKNDGSLGHKVYCKPTHTNLYLQNSSHHHPADK